MTLLDLPPIPSVVRPRRSVVRRAPDAVRDRAGVEAAVLVVLAWCAAVLPRVVQSLTAPKYRATVGDGVPLTSLATLLERGLTALVLGSCLLALVLRLPELRRRERGAVAACLLPWVYLVVRSIWAGTTPHSLQTLLYPMIVLAVWAIRPPLSRLAPLGWLTGVLTVGSLAMGVLLPAKGIYHAVSGLQVSPDKQLLPWGILVGPLTDGNNLGQVLVLGLPAVALIRPRVPRVTLLALTAVAIVWTSSRSSIGALAVALLVPVGLRLVRRGNRPGAAASALLVLAAVMVALPLLTTDPAAFTNRGRIWLASRAAWQDSFLTGMGPQWFSVLGRYADGLGGYAFHGHNEFVQTFVSGGLLAVLAAGLVLLLVGVRAALRTAEGETFPAAHLAAFLVSCTLEVSFGFIDRAVLLHVTALPMAFVLFARTPLSGSSRATAETPAPARPAARRGRR